MASIVNKMDFIRGIMAKYFGCTKDEVVLSLNYRVNNVWKVTAKCFSFPKESAYFNFGTGEKVTVAFDFNPDFVMKVG